MTNKIILCLSGGAMSGVFGAGVLTAFQEMNLYDNIKAIYGTSAGVMNGAYFLSKQTKIGSSIYYEDLTQNFIHPIKIPYGVIQRMYNGYISKINRKKIIDAVDINYLFKIIKKVKPLNVKKINNSPIQFYARLLNLSDNKLEWVNAKENTLKVLKAAVSIVPYYFPSQRINGKKYVDGAIKDPIGLEYLINEYQNHKIITIINIPIKRSFRQYIHNFLEGIVAQSMYNANMFNYFMHREKLIRKNIELANNNKNILLIYPPENKKTTVFTTDKEKLLETYQLGIKEANKIKTILK